MKRLGLLFALEQSLNQQWLVPRIDVWIAFLEWAILPLRGLSCSHRSIRSLLKSTRLALWASPLSVARSAAMLTCLSIRGGFLFTTNDGFRQEVAGITITHHRFSPQVLASARYIGTLDIPIRRFSHDSPHRTRLFGWLKRPYRSPRTFA